ncbi:MAG: stage III sporulation protein AB [Clostridia bacterium]|nr:stage III sporulation protein AB [Clostridia bacterium]
MVKLLAGAIIFFGCGYFGILFSQKFKERVRQLAEFQRALTELEYSIEFMGMTIGDALMILAKNSETELESVFLYVSERLKSSPGSDMQKIWQRALSKYSEGLALKKDDVEIILDFSKNLGTGNREKEKNNIKVTSMRLRIAEDEARAELERNSKMYRGLGFLSGIFVVIVLM